MSCDTISGCIFEDSTFTCLARVFVNGAIWSQAAVSTITYKVWKNTDLVNTIDSGSVTVATSVFDALQTDGRWTVDATGYNFRHTLGPTVITEPGLHTIEYKVTLASGAVFFLDPFEPEARNVSTS